MSKTEDQSNETTEETKKSPIGMIFAVLILLAIVIVVGLTNNAKVTTSDPTETAEAVKTELGTSTTAQAPDGTEIITQEVSADFDLEKASTPRILGNPDAPIKISEHSSFTCGGCAMFHKSNFKMIKEEYIDTGKAYVVFDDFPRNKYDIIIGSVAQPFKVGFNIS